MALNANNVLGGNMAGPGIEERLTAEIRFALPKMDPIFRMMSLAQLSGSKGSVELTNAMRNDYRIVMPVTVQHVRGVIEQNPSENWLYGAANKPIGRTGRTISFTSGFPDPRRDPRHRYIQFGVPMRAQTFTVAFSLFEDMADALPAFKGRLRGQDLEGFAENLARTQANAWWAEQNKYFQYGSYDVATGSIEAANSSSQTDVAGTGRDRLTVVLRERTEKRLAEGMQVDLVYSSEGSSNSDLEDNTININAAGVKCYGYVVSVDPYTGEVELEFWKPDSDGELVPAALGADSTDDFDPLPTGGIIALVPLNNHKGADATAATGRYGINGIHSFLKDDGNLLGDDALAGMTLDVDTIKGAKSVISDVDGPLTENLLVNHFATMLRGKGLRKKTIDTAFTTPGVLIAFNQTRLTNVEYNRELTGTKVPTLRDVGFDWEGTMIETPYGRIPIMASDWISSGLLYALPTKDNWKIFTPPTGGVTGFKSMPRSGEAQIPAVTIGRYIGYPSERVPILDATGTYANITDGYHIPGFIHYNICPEEPGGCLLMTGLTEDYYTPTT